MTTSFTHAVGRRKTAIASARLSPADKNSLTVNGKSAQEYFKTLERARIAEEALTATETKQNYTVAVAVSGGGISAQADAVRHAVSRALSTNEPETRKPLKSAGFLKRDPRAKERKKPGLKKARKSPQWSKR